MTASKRKPSCRALNHPASLRLHLEASCPAFASLTLKRRARLAGIFQSAMFRQHRHKLDDTLQVLHNEMLRTSFGSGGFTRLNETLGWFAVEIRPDNRRQIAAGWRLTDAGQSLLDSYLDAVHGAGVGRMEDEDGKPVRMPRAAVASNTVNGSKSRFRGSAMRAAVEVDGDALEALAQAAEAFIDGEPCPAGSERDFASWKAIAADTGTKGGIHKARARAELVRRQSRFMLEAARQSGVAGFVLPLVYIEATSGRLYSEGNPSIQGACREVKHAALKGCHEYDLENAHYQLLRQMAPDASMPAVDAYLSNKAATRQAIADEARVTIKQAKTIIISLVYGAELKPLKGCAIADEVGVAAAARICSSQTMRALNADVTAARAAIVEQYKAETRKVGVVVNTAGRELTLGAKVKDRHILSHILQGAESECLKACMDVAGGALVLPQHDGFASRVGLDMGKLSGSIRLRTGFDLELSEDVL